jgi:hypothetical protein
MFKLIAMLWKRTPRQPRRPAATRVQAHLRPWVEELSPRVLPSASPLGLGHGFDHHNHGFASASSIAQGAVTSDSSGQHAGCAGEATLVANLTNASGATGTASFNATDSSLKVQVSGATASSTLNVAVNGVNLGTLSTDASGSGKATFSNVTATAGTTVTVGDLTGTFAQVKFTASLTGTSGASGSASFNSVKNSLQVFLTGAAASTTYNVTIDGTVVGQIATNSSGSGKLKLTPSSLTIAAGSAISISDTLGNPAILTGVFA